MFYLSKSDIAEVEQTLEKPNVWLRRQLQEDTRKVTQHVDFDAKIELYAAITSNSGEKGVVKVAQYTAQDLYGYSFAPIVEFNNKVGKILDLLATIQAIKEVDVEFELQSTYFWKEVRSLNSFLGTSPFHNELISTLNQVALSERLLPFSKEKAQVFSKAFSIIHNQLTLSENVLDETYDLLEGIGMDINFAESFSKR